MKSLLLRFVKLARHVWGLVKKKIRPMKQGDQPRVAIAKLIILPKPGPNRIRAAGQPRRDKGFQSRLLLVRQLARTAFMAEIPQSRHALPLIDLEPLAHRVVVQQKRRPDLLAVPAVVQKNNRVRPPRHPVLHKAIPRDRYQCASLRCGQHSRANQQPHPNPPGPRCQPTASRVFVESRYITFLMYLTMFRTVRATEVLSVHGYPLQGYALQRSIKDQVFTLWAIANNMIGFNEIFGWQEGFTRGATRTE